MVEAETKAEVMQWMLDIQLGRRNLPPAQRISVVDKFKKNPGTSERKSIRSWKRIWKWEK